MHCDDVPLCYPPAVFLFLFFLMSDGPLLLRSCAISLTGEPDFHGSHIIDLISSHWKVTVCFAGCFSLVLVAFWIGNYVSCNSRLSVQMYSFSYSVNGKIYFILSIIYCTQQLLLWCIKNGLSGLICLLWTTASGISPCVPVLACPGLKPLALETKPREMKS